MPEFSENVENVEGEGNTNPPPPKKAKRDTKGKRWCFTYNNYSDDGCRKCRDYFRDKATNYIWGKEVGESGTPHLQGYVEFKSETRFMQLKRNLPKEISWRKSKGNRESNITYCSKDGTGIERTFPLTPEELKKSILQECLQEYDGVEWKPWQQKVLDVIDGPVDKRAIHWFYEPDGNAGKSYLSKYIALTKKVILGGGKANDVLNQCRVFLEEAAPEVILMDVPRSSKEYVNYGLMEKLKDGCAYSGKYEGGVLLFKAPHFIVFANEAPDTSKMSKDRWAIYRIAEGGDCVLECNEVNWDEVSAPVFN